jgi:hypothetical protein
VELKKTINSLNSSRFQESHGFYVSTQSKENPYREEMFNQHKTNSYELM